MMGWYGGGWGVGAWIAMSLMIVVFWGGLAALVVWLVRGSRNEHPVDGAADPTERSEEVLAERFARGEIDEAEFLHRRDVLHPR